MVYGLWIPMWNMNSKSNSSNTPQQRVTYHSHSRRRPWPHLWERERESERGKQSKNPNL